MPRMPVTVTLPDELIEQIDSKAKECGKNRSQMLEALAQQALQGKAEEAGFYESIQIRGGTATMLGVLRGMLGEGSSVTFDPERQWIVKFLMQVNAGESPLGGMKVVETGAPSRRKSR